MKILVFDIPAEFGGVYTILKEFYNSIHEEKSEDFWTFIVGIAPDIVNKRNVTVKRYPWAKKNWIFRLLFDMIFAPIVIRRVQPDVIVSFHNNGIRGAKVPQVLYMHQAMMLSGKRYKFCENKIYWFYQNIQSKSAFRYMRNNTTIVQTEWMKNAIIDQAHVDPERVHVVSPVVGEYNPSVYTDSAESRHLFFYPVNYMPYKRHDVILDAIDKMNQKVKQEYKIIFTVDVPILNQYSDSIKEHIDITGRLPRNEINNIYAHSILVFPSELESFGLPLLEARLSGSIILAAKTPFACEILRDYENVYYFSPGNSEELAKLMENCMNGEVVYYEPKTKYKYGNYIGWNPIIDIIKHVGSEDN